MNRRLFLQRFSTGVVGALALAHVPAAVVKAVGLQEPARRYACEYLRKVYNEYCIGRPIWDYPRRMEAGRELFEAYEGELIANERFVVFGDHEAFKRFGGPTLMFKGAVLVPRGRGWSARVTEMAA